MIEGVACGCVEVFIIARGPRWSLLMAFLFSYFSSSEFGCIYIDVQGHSFIYTTCILSCSNFYIYYIVDGMYFKI